jgi:hypothetical protein
MDAANYLGPAAYEALTVLRAEERQYLDWKETEDGPEPDSSL